VTGDKFGQGHRDHPVTVVGRVLVAQRCARRGVAESGHQLGESRPCRGGEHGPGVAQVVEPEVLAPGLRAGGVEHPVEGRRGELFALKWKAFDESKATLFIQEAIYENVIDTPKTSKSIRKIPLSPALVRLLLDWRKSASRDMRPNHEPSTTASGSCPSRLRCQ